MVTTIITGTISITLIALYVQEFIIGPDTVQVIIRYLRYIQM